MNAGAQALDEIRQAYARMTSADRLRSSRVACVLVLVLMPLGYLMDAFVYPTKADYLFQLRLMTSVGAGLVWLALGFRFWKPWQVRVLCMGWYLVPSFFISWMIHSTEGASSTYYAGLNLVILAVSSVIQATILESIVAVGLITAMYLVACLTATGPIDWRVFVNNLTFIFYTICIVITGNFFYNRLRFREFVLRFELDGSRRQLEETNRQLRELDELKSRFFANISHELRTPLTLLIAPLETLIQRFGPRVDGETHEILSSMQVNAMRLLKLINNLLDLVRLESGRIIIKNEPVDIAELLRGLASAARQVAEQKRLRLETVVDPAVGTVVADRDKLEKILLNLQFNAIKFTPEGGRIELRARRDGPHLALEVSDTGVGIPAEKLPQVFNRFFQADDSAQRKFQGVGLGLALVKELSEAMGGSVSVKSEAGQGSTFTVCLPYVEVSADAVEAGLTSGDGTPPGAVDAKNEQDQWLVNLYRRAELVPAAALQQSLPVPEPLPLDESRPLVLVADDEPDMRRFLSRQIAGKYRVAEASDGVQALDKALHLRPSLILLDMMMPEMDGLQVCRKLREHVETQATPIIMLTARADEETKLSALSAGANDYLTKPFVTAELEARVRNLITTGQYQQQLSEQNRTLSDALGRLKDAESELVQTEKLASLGRLSAGIIHEINNPLNYATTGLFALRGKTRHLAPELQGEYAEILRDVEEGLNRVTTIVSDLRAFAHRENSTIDPVNVAEVVQSALRFLSHELKDQARVICDLPKGLTVPANRNKLIQVLVNLVQNSMDALADKSFADEQPTIWIEGRVENGKILLAVRDNGDGIEPGNLNKIFDPFFTTKDVGEGMGLGLSICYRIVQEFQGRILVRSEPGRFCEFAIEFPQSLNQSAAARSA